MNHTLERRVELNPLAEKRVVRESEIVENVSFESKEYISDVLGKYCPVDFSIFGGLGSPLRWVPELKRETFRVLEPADIDLVLQALIISQPKHVLEDHYTGHFISKLLQASYDAGNNDFVLTTGDFNIRDLGGKLKGKKDNPLRLIIEGNCGYGFGHWSEFCDYLVNGNAQQFFGEINSDSRFTIHGTVGSRPGEYSDNCLFETTNMQAYNTLLKEVPNLDKDVDGNKVRLLR